MADSSRRLAILDVGHGNCAVLHDRGGVVVIDAGPGTALLKYLKEHRVKRVEVVLISHADRDHIQGLLGLLAAQIVEIGKVRLNSDAMKDTALWNKLAYELNQAHKAGQLDFDVSLVEDDTGKYNCGDVHIQIVAPNRYLAARGPGSTDRRGRKMIANSISAVIRLRLNEKPVAVFPGDVDEIALDSLLEDAVDAIAPILVFPHHGGQGGDDLKVYIEKVCRAFAPSTIVFSVARGHEKHPLPEVIELVRQHLESVRIVCTQLTTHCAAETPTTDPTHLNPDYADGRKERECCGGTLVISLDNLPRLLPSADAHGQFIDASAPTAMCRRSIDSLLRRTPQDKPASE